PPTPRASIRFPYTTLFRSLRDVVITAMSVGARAFVILHSNFIGRQTEHASHAGARSVDVLGGAHDQRGIRFHVGQRAVGAERRIDRKSTRLNSSHQIISYA